MTRVVSFFGIFAILAANTSVALAQSGKKTENVVKVTAKADKAKADGSQIVTVTIAIDRDWHLYANPVGNDDLKSGQTDITITGADKPQTTKSDYPKGKKVKDALVGDYAIYEETVEAKFTIKRPAGSKGAVEVAVKCQACNDKSCLPPATIKVKVDQ